MLFFSGCACWRPKLRLPLELLDIDILFEGSQATLQFLGQEDALETLANGLQAAFAIEVRFENLSQSTSAALDENNHGGCGKPDCGKTSGGSCTTCSSQGGCPACQG